MYNALNDMYKEYTAPLSEHDEEGSTIIGVDQTDLSMESTRFSG